MPGQLCLFKDESSHIGSWFQRSQIETGLGPLSYQWLEPGKAERQTDDPVKTISTSWKLLASPKCGVWPSALEGTGGGKNIRRSRQGS